MLAGLVGGASYGRAGGVIRFLIGTTGLTVEASKSEKIGFHFIQTVRPMGRLRYLLNTYRVK